MIHHNKDKAYAERNRQKAKEYYYQHREEILARQKKIRDLNRKPKPLRKDLSDVLEEWNGQLYQKLQETLPQWLEIALRDQIIINDMLANQYEK